MFGMANETGMEVISTRERLLEAAGRLFLNKGYDGVSVRDITEAAGVNVAAVNYHFNGKKNLYREFLGRQLSGRTRAKVGNIREAVGRGRNPDIREVVRLLVGEFLGEILSSGETVKLMRLVTEEMSGQGVATDVVFNELSSPVHKVMKEAILKAKPGISEEKASLCIFSITGQLIHFVRAREIVRRITGRDYGKEFLDDIVEHITEFSVKGIGK